MSLRSSAFGLAAAFAAAGCQSILGLEEGNPRPGGDGGSPSSSSSISSGSAASSSATTAGSGGAGGEGGPSAGDGGAGGCDASACPPTMNDCLEAYCNDLGECDVRGRAELSPCSEGGLCDGEGTCLLPACNDGEQNGDETGVDCGGSQCPTCPVMLLLCGGSATAVVAGEYRPSSGTWTVVERAGATSELPALAITAEGEGVGLLRYTGGGVANDELRYLSWHPADGWSTVEAVSPGVATRSAPAISAGASGAHVIYQQLNYQHAYVAWTGSGWVFDSDAVIGGAGNPSYGPSAPAAAANGADVVAAYMQGSSANPLVARTRQGGVWAAAAQEITGNTNFNIAPVMVTLTADQDRLALYVRVASVSPSNQLMFTRQDASSAVWAAPQPVGNAFTTQRPSLAALPSGEAIAAFRGTNGKLYTSRYTGASWLPPQLVMVPPGTSDVAIVGSPAVARGVGDAEVELVYVTEDMPGGIDRHIHHIRFRSGAWTAPVTITGGAGLSGVALASAP